MTSLSITPNCGCNSVHQRHVRDPNTTPYPKLGKGRRDRSASPSKSTSSNSKSLHSMDAPSLDKYGEARSVLHSVAAEREMLEKNLELMLRSRQDIDIYTLMGGANADRSVLGTCRQLFIRKTKTEQWGM